jgi:hypothetical protein
MIRLVLAAIASAPFLAVAQSDTGAAPPAPTSAGEPTVAAPAPATGSAPLREGVYVGVGFGTSNLFSPDARLLAYRIRLGMTRSPRLQLGLEIHHAEDDGAELNFTDVSATFFPWRRIFFVRGGFGFSSIIRPHAVYGGPGLYYMALTGADGVNLLAGLGAQLGRSNGVNFTVNVEGQVHRLSGLSSDHPGEGTVTAWLGLEWH